MGMLTRDGWTLREAGSSDIEALMQWFPTHDDINVWGGPSFRYPFTCETFFEDVYWEKMASFCLSSPCGDLVAFGQLYDRDNRIHLARLVVAPGMRGQGLGRALAAAAEEWARVQGCTEMASDTDPFYPISPVAHTGLGYATVAWHFRKEL